MISSFSDIRLRWRCEPSNWSVPAGRLVIAPDAPTDFWSKTHYGFEADNGHFLYANIAGDFVLSAEILMTPRHQYDQAGLMVRLSKSCWLKASIEFEPDKMNRLGAVVTNAGYSDWSTQPILLPALSVGRGIDEHGAGLGPDPKDRWNTRFFK